MLGMRSIRRRAIKTTPGLAIAGLAVLAFTTSCTEEAFHNATSPLGTGTINSRDDVRLFFFNRTPYRAIFTFGLFNLMDQNTVPNFNQVSDGENGRGVLEGDAQAGPITFTCDRTLGIASAQLIQAVRDLDAQDLDEDALFPFVGFSSAPLDDPLGTLPTVGTAEGMNILQGADFPCDADLLIVFEEDPSSAGGFRIAFEVVPPG